MTVKNLLNKINPILILLLILSTFLADAAPVSAAPASAGLSVESLLRPDGTLNTQAGVSGSLSLTGWDVSLNPALGPVFAPAGSGSSDWGPLGTGMDGIVSAIAIHGTDVYVGGYFTSAGGVTVNGIAKWNGTNWSGLGSGVNTGGVYAIAVFGTDVYVGGTFTSMNGIAANNIAKWNGTIWSALGTGMDDTVNAIAISGTGDVYVGGYFHSAGGVTNRKHIAKYSSGSWFALDTGMEGPVYAIAVSGADVYVGGNFTSAGGVPANYIAKWNGGTWSALGSGMNTGSNVLAIAVSGTDVYVGGYFTSAGGVTVNGIAKLNGTSWTALGSGVNNAVNAIAVSGTGDVYAGGNFTSAGGVANTKYIAVYSLPSSSSSPAPAAAGEKFSKLPKTGFAPNRISVLQAQPASLAYTKMSGLWLEIPSQKVQTYIVGVPNVNNNWDVSWLGQSAGWLNGTAYPTWSGNSVITAHVTDANGLPGPFANIKNLDYGNQIVVHQYGEKYTFEVRETRMVLPSSTTYALGHLEGHSYLTLITCQGYNFLTDNYMFRRLVRAVLVKVEAE